MLGKYPLKYPEHSRDERFSRAFLDDLSAVFSAHGYPDPRESGRDFSRLQVVLYNFLYGPFNRGGRW